MVALVLEVGVGRSDDPDRGYDSVAEIGALSSLDPALLDHQADRLIVLPWQPR